MEVRNDQAKVEEGIQALGRGGGNSHLLAVTEKKGHVMWKTRVVEGDDRETFQPLLHHREMFQEEWSETSMKGGSQLHYW